MQEQLLKLSRYFKNKTKPNNNKSSPRIKGIVSQNQAFCGPKIAQIDITNNCNLNCVGCWCHSELMQELKFSGELKKTHLSLETLKKLIDDLIEMKTEEIQLSGSGDPSMHPDFLEVVNYIKEKKLRLHIITNFTLFTKPVIDEIIRLQVEKLTVSFWAGSVETYLRTHPNMAAQAYYKIKENLEYLNETKKTTFPKVRIYNVISSLNYNDIEPMIRLALDVFADHIEFQAIDIVEGKSDSLALTRDMSKEVIMQFERIKTKFSFTNIPENKNLIFLQKKELKNEFMEFSRIINQKSLPPYFTIGHSDKLAVYCRKNEGTYALPHGSVSVHEDNKKENAFHFSFDKKFCTTNKCRFFNTCAIDKTQFKVKAKFLSILGIGTFLRRIKNISESGQKYDINIVDTIPCYIGWTYTRILPNGDVIPCCKAHKKPLGNINEKSFKEIWHSHTYNNFRFMAKTKKKNNEYFKEINCYKSCDNVGMNLETHLIMKKTGNI